MYINPCNPRASHEVGKIYFHQNNEVIEIPELNYGLGYERDITAGEIRFIEIITYENEIWNGKTENYNLISAE